MCVCVPPPSSSIRSCETAKQRERENTFFFPFPTRNFKIRRRWSASPWWIPPGAHELSCEYVPTNGLSFFFSSSSKWWWWWWWKKKKEVNTHTHELADGKRVPLITRVPFDNNSSRGRLLWALRYFENWQLQYRYPIPTEIPVNKKDYPTCRNR